MVTNDNKHMTMTYGDLMRSV